MSKHYRIEFGMGTGYDKDGRLLAAMPGPWFHNAFNQIEQRAIDLFGGFTWVNTVGGWKDDAGIVTCEPGRTLLIYSGEIWEQSNGNTVERAKNLAQFIAQKLNQQAVALSIQETDFQFVAQ